MYRIGIDLGGTNIKVGIIDNENVIVDKMSVPTLAERDYKEVIADMAHSALELLKRNQISATDCSGIGIGSPGTVDSIKKEVIYSNNFNWNNIPLGEELNRHIDLPISISNDANCAALGETVAGAAKGSENVILLTLGTGVGGGIIINGKIFEGGHAGGAEIGHATLFVDGELCTCGRKGCLEAYASATALIRETKRLASENPNSLIHELCGNDLSRVDGIIPFDAAKKGDSTGKTVIDNYIKYLSEGIVDMINIFRPDKVLLSGGVCNQGEVLTKPINEYVRKYCFGGEKTYIPEVTIAKLGNDAGLIGAAALLK